MARLPLCVCECVCGGGQAGSINEHGVSDLCFLKTREPKTPKAQEKPKPIENARYFRFSEKDETETENIEVQKEKVSVISEGFKREKTKRQNERERTKENKTQRQTQASHSIAKKAKQIKAKKTTQRNARQSKATHSQEKQSSTWPRQRENPHYRFSIIGGLSTKQTT